MRFCTVREERLHIQTRDKMFASGSRHTFNTPQRSKLLSRYVATLAGSVGGAFYQIGKSRSKEIPALEELQQRVDYLALQSMGNDDMLSIVDVRFSAEDVSGVVGRLKNRKAAGDGVAAKHLNASGKSVIIWLVNILNAVLELDILKRGVVVPVYKRKGPTAGS